MKPRVYKSGSYWVAECDGLRYVYHFFDTAVWSALRGFPGLAPVPQWIACRLEPIGV